MFINILLFIMSGIIIALGLIQLIDQGYKQRFNIIVFIIGLFAFLWCFGYGMMGLQLDFFRALIYRNIGLLGVLGFIMTEYILIIYVSNVWPKFRNLALLFTVVLSIVDYACYSSEGVLSFYRLHERTSYLVNYSFFCNIHYFYIIVLFSQMFIIGYLWYKKTNLIKNKQIIKYIWIVNFCILFSSLADTIIPLFGFKSIPFTAFGAFVAYLVICYTNNHYSGFRITNKRLGEYVYKKISLPIIIFDSDFRTLLMNDYAKDFFNIDNNKNISIIDLFQLTKEENDDLYNKIVINNTEIVKEQYITKNSETTCNLIFHYIQETDSILCFVNDISMDIQRLGELNIEKQKLQDEIKEKSKKAQWAVFQAIKVMANTIDAKDEYTSGHSLRVAEYSKILALHIGWSQERAENLYNIALIHDIGKIGIPDSVLNKVSKLNDMEYKLIQSHTTIGGEILKDITIVENLAYGAKYHHEKYDGTGYPDGLKGEEIPVEARIIAVADAYDAMNTNRIYRKKLSQETIKKQIENGINTQFDPVFANDFLALINSGVIGDYDPESDNKYDVNRTDRILQFLIDKNKKNDDKVLPEEKNENHYDEIDYVTGVYSRKIGIEHMKEYLKTMPGFIAVVDIDNLKRVNNFYGHLVGDYALKILGKILLDYKNKIIAIRYRGDEFVLLFKTYSQDEVKDMMDKIFYNYKCTKESNANLKRLSLSAGIAMIRLNDDLLTVYQKASKVLYNVKQTGKNRYEFYKIVVHEDTNRSVLDLRILMNYLKSDKLDNDLNKVDGINRIYRFIKKQSANCSDEMQLMLVTLQNKEGEEGIYDKQEYFMSGLFISIVDVIKDSNLIIRYSNLQYLILYKGNKQDAKGKITAVFKKFYKLCNDQYIDISYDIVRFKEKE